MRDFLKKGEISMPILLTVCSMIAGSIIWITSIGMSNQSANAEISERVAKIETLTPVMQSDIKEIKEDLKDIKRALNVK